jgi:segregation and condensation protein A
MVEKTIPWWRKALEFALGGFRSGFGLFSRPARPEPVPEPMVSSSIQESPEEDRALTEPSTKYVAAPMIPDEPLPAAERVRATEKGRDASDRAEKHSSGAKAPVDPVASTYGLKPVPFTEASISSDRDTQPETGAEAASLPDAGSEPVSEPVVVTEPAETPESDVVHEAVPEPIEVAESEPVSEPVVVTEPAEFHESEAVNEVIEEPEPVIEAEPEAAAEPVSASDLAPAALAAEPSAVADPEPVSAPYIETVKQIESEPVSDPAIESVALAAAPPLVAEPEPAPEPIAAPVPIAMAVSQRMLKPQPSAEEKEAARKAARQKKLDEGSEESPFSVIVGQVYDGPLDLLLDLIRKQDIDIYDIPIAIITSQFLAYVNQLRASDVDVAGDFIYTASLLIHIKSKMLLPHAETGPEAAAEDPRRELVERLLEHERFKNAAQMLLEKQMLEAATWSNPGAREFKDDEAAEPEIAADTVDLVRIFREILERARNRPVINVEEDSVTVGQMIQFLARRLTMEDKPVALRRLLSHTRSERALIAMFLALLEMVRLQAILLRQDRQFSEIFIKKHSNFDTVMNEGLGSARDDWR